MTQSSPPEKPGSLRPYRVQKEASAKNPKIRNAEERVKARQEKSYREEADTTKKSLIMSKDQKLLSLLKKNPENQSVELLRAGDLKLPTEISESAEYKNLSEPNESNVCALKGNLAGIYLVKNKLNKGGAESAKLYVNFKGSFRALLIEPSENGDEKKIFVLDKNENGKAAKIDLKINFKGELDTKTLETVVQKAGEENKAYVDTVEVTEFNTPRSEARPEDHSPDIKKTEQKFLERVNALQDVVKGAFGNFKTVIEKRIKAFDQSINQTVLTHKLSPSVFETGAGNSEISLTKVLEQLRRLEENKPLSRESDVALPFIRSLIQTGKALSAFTDGGTEELYNRLLSNLTEEPINIERLRQGKESLIASVIPNGTLDDDIKNFLTKDLQASFDKSASDLYRGRIEKLLDPKTETSRPASFPEKPYIRSLNVLLNALTNGTSEAEVLNIRETFRQANNAHLETEGKTVIEKWKKVAEAVASVYKTRHDHPAKTENLRALLLKLETALKQPEPEAMQRQVSVAEAELPEITATKNNA